MTSAKTRLKAMERCADAVQELHDKEVGCLPDPVLLEIRRVLADLRSKERRLRATVERQDAKLRGE